jgi:hypothetical protein
MLAPEPAGRHASAAVSSYMSVACGIVGLPNVGKSTIFSAFTATFADRAIYPFSTPEANLVMRTPTTAWEKVHQFIATDRSCPRSCKSTSPPRRAREGRGPGNKCPWQCQRD